MRAVVVEIGEESPELGFYLPASVRIRIGSRCSVEDLAGRIRGGPEFEPFDRAGSRRLGNP